MADSPSLSSVPEAAKATDVGVIKQLGSPSPLLVIVFGGLTSGFGGTPPFEFLAALSKVTAANPANTLFLRDHHAAWYHRGVRGFAHDIMGVESGLRTAIDESQTSKVVMLGCSAGGYAALLFGRLMQVAEVHAFGPQTFISPDLRQRYCDDRWRRTWTSLLLSGGYQRRYGDLYGLFRTTPSARTRFVVHYGSKHELDAIHAERLGRHEDVELREHDLSDHNVAKHLRDTGELQSLVRNALRM